MQILKPKTIYASPRYYPGLKAGNLITTAGRIAIDLDGSIVAPNNAGAQTEHIMDCLSAILAEGGATLQDVVLIHTYFLYEEDMKEIFEVIHREMGAHRPPHTGIHQDSSSWEEKGIRLEIEVTAVVED
ncbi:MAG: RidA family protein [Anaerolineaceae bacterium]|nr:RidA family protein [Anaerolineaceae bacterium]